MVRIFENRRSWRVQFLLWMFALVTAGFALMALHGFVTGHEGNMIVGAILAPIGLIAALGMEFYARRYVTLIDYADGKARVATRSLTGLHVNEGAADIGPLRKLLGISIAGEAVVSAVETQHFMLKLTPPGKSFIVDVTADPQIRERIAQALGAS